MDNDLISTIGHFIYNYIFEIVLLFSIQSNIRGIKDWEKIKKIKDDNERFNSKRLFIEGWIWTGASLIIVILKWTGVVEWGVK